MIADAIARLRMNNQAVVYINDEKNAREPTNLSVPILAIPLIPEGCPLGRPVTIRENRTFSDVLLVMGTVLDPQVFPTIKDKPRQQQYHNIASENIGAFTQQINGNLKQAYTVIKSENASFTHIDVHFAKGGANNAAKLESAAATEVTFIEGSDQVEIVDTDNGDGHGDLSQSFQDLKGVEVFQDLKGAEVYLSINGGIFWLRHHVGL